MSIPDWFEGPLTARGEIDLEGFGSARVVGVDPERPGTLPGGRLRLQLRAPKLRVYDIWASVDGGWFQLNRAPGEPDGWLNEDLHGRTIQSLRLWVGASWDMTLEPAPPRQAGSDSTPPDLPIEAARSIGPYVPIMDGEPPLPGDRADVELSSRVRRWVRDLSADVVVGAMLEEWTTACAEAAALGWMAGLPRGEDLLEVYARASGGDPRVGDHDQGFARWLTAELGRATRNGVRDRRDLEARRPGVRLLQRALARVVRAVAEDLVANHAPPPVVGPGQRHEWLVDDAFAAMVDNPVITPGSHRPIFVVRPLLSRRGLVLVEGEVV